MHTIRPARRYAIALVAISLFGCSVTTQERSGVTITQAPKRTLRWDDAIPIDRLRDDRHDVDLHSVLQFEDHDAWYFGQADTYDRNGETIATIPIIVAGAKDEWAAISLADPRVANAEWQFVASGPGAEEIWGVLDDTLTHRGKGVLLVHSTDAGVSWAISHVVKPFDSGEYDSFAMSRNGHGRLTIYLAPAAAHSERAGFYHFRTRDGGKSWSAPQHEADGLDPADEAGDDPPPLRSTPIQTARLKSKI